MQAAMTYTMLPASDGLFSFYRPDQLQQSEPLYISSKSPERLAHDQSASIALIPASVASLDVGNISEEKVVDRGQPCQIWESCTGNRVKSEIYSTSDALKIGLDVDDHMGFDHRAQNSTKFSAQLEVHNQASRNIENRDQREHSGATIQNPAVSVSTQRECDHPEIERATMTELIQRLKSNITGHGQGSYFTAPLGIIPTHSSQPAMSTFTVNGNIGLSSDQTSSNLTEPTFRLPLLTDKDFPFINQQSCLTDKSSIHGQFVLPKFSDKIEKMPCGDPQNKVADTFNPSLLTSKLDNADVIKVLFEDEGNLGYTHSSTIDSHTSFYIGSRHTSKSTGILEGEMLDQAPLYEILGMEEFGRVQKTLSNSEQPSSLHTFSAGLNVLDGNLMKKQKLYPDLRTNPWKSVCFDSNSAAGSVEELLAKRFDHYEGTIIGVRSMAERSSSGNSEYLNSRLIREIPKPQEPPKQDYIHVRARRGQATDSHSLAERVRREKISERMKFLQDLVPGCNKVTGKAMMLDEIINYVQSLQRQVEFLSMKLAALNPRIEMSLDYLLETQASQSSAPTTDVALTLQHTNENLRFDQLQQLQSEVGLFSINMADTNPSRACTPDENDVAYKSFVEFQQQQVHEKRLVYHNKPHHQPMS